MQNTTRSASFVVGFDLKWKSEAKNVEEYIFYVMVDILVKF